MSSDRATIYCTLGITYNDLRRYPEALAALKMALQIDPDFGPAYYHLGITYEGLGFNSRAVDAFHEALRRMPDCAAARCHLKHIGPV